MSETLLSNLGIIFELKSFTTVSTWKKNRKRKIVIIEYSQSLTNSVSKERIEDEV